MHGTIVLIKQQNHLVKQTALLINKLYRYTKTENFSLLMHEITTKTSIKITV